MRSNEREGSSSIKPLVSPNFLDSGCLYLYGIVPIACDDTRNYDIESILLHTCTLRVVCARTCATNLTTDAISCLSLPPARPNPANEANRTIRHSLDAQRKRERETYECGQWAAAIINETPYLWELAGTALSHVLLLLRNRGGRFLRGTREQQPRDRFFFRISLIDILEHEV